MTDLWPVKPLEKCLRQKVSFDAPLVSIYFFALTAQHEDAYETLLEK